MNSAVPRSIAIRVDQAHRVSALLLLPPSARVCCVLAPGAGAGMTHSFMAAIAEGLAQRNIATLRYQFPYMERGAKRPDAPELAHRTVRAAVAEASHRAPGLALFAGGKSFGGRMTSQAQATSPMPGVLGLVFLGFPLHPPAQPSSQRGEHLLRVQIPMLFVQGTRDAFAEVQLLQRLTEGLGARATLRLFQDADHSFHLPKRTARKDSELRDDMLNELAGWMEATTPSG